jgi:hypothetical protein
MNRYRPLLLAFVLLASACAGTAVAPTSPAPEPSVPEAAPGTDQGSTPSVTVDDPAMLPSHLARVTNGWTTDWSRRTIDLDELLVGISASDARDRIPPIDVPKFERVPVVEWLADNEPGIVFVEGTDARFYPLSVLMRHEIVNDRVGGTPVAVTYCPLCNTAVVFERSLDGNDIRLGVSGLLRNSDLVMWDRASNSLWQQVTGEGIVGTHAGRQLTLLPSRIVSYGAFVEAFPSGLALGPDQGLGPVYGVNPYVSYSSRSAPYPFFTQAIDPRLPALDRVVGVDLGGAVKGYPFGLLAELRVVNDVVGGVPVTVWWGDPATADALDEPAMAASEGIGTGVAYLSTVDGEVLTFEAVDEATFRDLETGSTWTLFGEAFGGPLAGTSLEVALHRNEFWFAFAAFFPDAALATAEG